MRSTWDRSIRRQQYLFKPRASRASLWKPAEWDSVRHHGCHAKIKPTWTFHELTLLYTRLEEDLNTPPICSQQSSHKWSSEWGWSWWRTRDLNQRQCLLENSGLTCCWLISIIHNDQIRAWFHRQGLDQGSSNLSLEVHLAPTLIKLTHLWLSNDPEDSG